MIDDSIKMDHIHFLHIVVYIGIEGRQFERKILNSLRLCRGARMAVWMKRKTMNA